MTDNEIVKAWIVVLENKRMPTEYLINATIDSINRLTAEGFRQQAEINVKNRLIDEQKAEIEELKLKNSNLTSDLSSLKNDLSSAEAEIERSKKSNRNWRRKVQRLKADNNELIYKLECLLCHSTGGKLSKHTYPLGTMESYVNDTIQEYCEEAEKEAKAEAYKEFAERLRFEIVNKPSEFKAEQGTVDFLNGHAYRHLETLDILDNLLKELVGDENDD